MCLLPITNGTRGVFKNKLFNCKYNKLLFSITTSEKPIGVKAGGYSQAFEKLEKITENVTKSSDTFASLLRRSRFIDLGDPEGKVVTGRIFHIVDDDLYIDFGWKFHCVSPRPQKNSSNYVRGAKVRLRIKDLELSSQFLGYEKDLTLLEANCIVLGLVQERNKEPK